MNTVLSILTDPQVKAGIVTILVLLLGGLAAWLQRKLDKMFTADEQKRALEKVVMLRGILADTIPRALAYGEAHGMGLDGSADYLKRLIPDVVAGLGATKAELLARLAADSKPR